MIIILNTFKLNIEQQMKFKRHDIFKNLKIFEQITELKFKKLKFCRSLTIFY